MNLVSTPDLFFIAVIPPPEICEAVMVFKSDLQDRFGSRASMKIIPHITLKAPFKIPSDQEPDLRRWFMSLRLPDAAFPVRLDGFGSFPKSHSPVLYVKPELSPELAQLQHSILVQFNDQYPDLPVSVTEKDFHPHITVAYRDLKPDMFRLAWVEYEHMEYESAFFADAVHLLRHNGKSWEVIESVEFQ